MASSRRTCVSAKILRRVSVVPKMKINGISPLVRRGDFSDGAIDGTYLDLPRRYRDDGALQRGLNGITASDIDPVSAAIDPVDRIMAIVDLVREASRHGASNEPFRRGGIGRIVDRVIRGNA
jgi:hypothetical protein